MNMTEKTLSSKTVYDGKIIKVELNEVELLDGSKSFREEVKHSGGACVFCAHNGKIPLVSQFRYAYKKEVWEIPAGKLEKGEDPKACARRELIEEVGLESENLTLISKLYPSPGYTNEIIYIYFADNCKYIGQKLDSGEFLKVEYFTISELLEMAKSGEICDAKTLVAIYAYANSLKN